MLKTKGSAFDNNRLRPSTNLACALFLQQSVNARIWLMKWVNVLYLSEFDSQQNRMNRSSSLFFHNIVMHGQNERHFAIYFHAILKLNVYDFRVCPWTVSQHCLGSSSTPNRQRTITRTNDDSTHRRTRTAEGPSVLTHGPDNTADISQTIFSHSINTNSSFT